MKNRRIVVTGMGMLSPLGLNVKDSWENILKGKSGIVQIDEFVTEGLPVTISGLVPGFDANQYFSSKEARKLDDFILYGVAAAEEAIADSGLVFDNDRLCDRAGVAIGAGIGGLPNIVENTLKMNKGGARKVSPFFIPGSIINMVPGVLSIRHKLKGPNISIVTACTTSAHNIGYAARMIAYGDADIMIAGGTEKASCPLGLAGFASMRALSRRNDDPQTASRPWDKDRDGFVLSDGAGVLVLEEYEHAKARGANIYAELSGFGASGDAYHMTMPDIDGTGGFRAMQAAMQDAGVNPETIQYINAHATSTPAGDELEIKAIKRALGDHVANVAVSSTKSMTGHLLGAAGAIEAVFSILAIRDQVAPPTINLMNPSDGCDIDLVANEAKPMSIQSVISNSFGFGGTNGSLLFEKV